MAWRPHGHASVDATSPEAWGVCDRDGMVYNLNKLKWQFYWRGPRLQNVWLRVCERCLDKPNEQRRPIILPPDPVPVYQPRPENFTLEDAGSISAAESATPPVPSENVILDD